MNNRVKFDKQFRQQGVKDQKFTSRDINNRIRVLASIIGRVNLTQYLKGALHKWGLVRDPCFLAGKLLEHMQCTRERFS